MLAANFWANWGKNQKSSASSPLTLSWVVPRQLALGRLPRTGEDQILAHAGIQAVVTLCAPGEGTLPTEFATAFQCHCYQLPDSHYDTPLTVEALGPVVEHIQNHIEQQRPVYIHCLAGIERSPTICIAYLCRYHKLELWEAVNCLKQLHPRSAPTQAQLQVVRQWLEGRN